MVNFCGYCGTLMMPGMDRCPQCRKANEGLQSNQMGLFEMDYKRTSEPKMVEDASQMKAPYLPYEPREGQLTIISDIRNALDEGKHAVIESGTGTGKTIVSLAAALEHAIPTGKRIIYMTRTISQSDQVMKELKAISKLRPISGITVTGRGKSCLLFKGTPGFEGDSSGLLARMCEDHKAKNKCPYCRNLKDKLPDIETYCRNSFPRSDDFDEFCRKENVCPYEMRKLIMKGCDVVTVPYIHILSEDIRSNLLRNMDVEDDHILLIIDEAHNLIDSARGQGSFRITMSDIANAIDEATTMKGDPYLYEGVKLSEFLQFLKRTVRSLANDKLGFQEKEKLLKPRELEETIFNKFTITRGNFDLVLDQMTDLGEERMEKLLESGEVGVSYILELATNLRKWTMTSDDSYIRAIKTDEDGGEYLSASCIDPFDVTYFIRKQKGVIHMSGTLRPLEQYVKTLALPADTFTNTYPSPFPKENRKVVYLNDVTTRQQDMKKDPSIFSRMERKLAKMINAADMNTMVMFTSYRMMKDMREYMERDVHRPMYWEERNKSKNERALNQFRMGRDGVFFTVISGSLSEGIDFPGDELSLVIIVGIPYPPPNLENMAMKDMFDKKYGPGMGFRYVSEAPAARKIKQAIGRLIRTETDRGIAVIMDNRASRFAKDLDAELTDDPIGDVKKFFDKS